ncbi:MAG: amino-acid N-acetyltransferase [Gammaproteobacteria bacterium]|nr:MAG: amino-acid N-acetyltransferase [Gammaproteobacteria bacterium]
MTDSLQFIYFFRQAAPYIHQHRDKTFVFCIQDDETTQSVLKSLLHDIAILHSLRVRVVIVFGARYTLNQQLKDQRFHQNRRITDAKALQQMQSIVGALGIQVQAILSMGLANSPMQGASIQTGSGNFVIAKPLGVRDGVDFGLTGEIRKVRSEAIRHRLDSGEIVVIPPLGYSSTGEVFNLTTEAVAGAVASALKADKLLFFNDAVVKFADTRDEGKVVTSAEANALADNNADEVILSTVLKESAAACKQGVSRVHIIPKQTDGAVLAELFTRDGFGLMVTNEAYDRIEQATFDNRNRLF